MPAPPQPADEAAAPAEPAWSRQEAAAPADAAQAAWPEPPAAEPPAPAEPAASPAPAPAEDTSWDGYDDDTRSRFAHEPPFRARVNRLKLFTWAAGLFAAVSLATIAMVSWYGLPDWMPMSRPTFAEAQPDLVLDFPPNRQDRRTLPNGSELFAASGTVTNVGRARRTVPTILIVLRDSRERIVYSWEVAPAKRQLAPGESVTVNEAVTDVPKSATIAEIGWKPG